jgi:ATP-dependent DNA ligase
MIALVYFVLAVLASQFKSKSRLEAENAALRHQLIVLRRKVRGRAQLTNSDRWSFIQLYRWFPLILEALTIIHPETLMRWHRVGFRLLWRDGDLRKLPQMERKRMLSDLLGENDIGLPVIYSEHLIGDGQEIFEHAAKLNFEGIVSENAQAPYRSDRNEGWLKIKTVQKGKFPVIGFVKDPSGVAALYLGKREGKDLVYMGKVGTGWSRTVSSQIRKQLDTVVSPKSKLTKPVKKPKAT